MKFIVFDLSLKDLTIIIANNKSIVFKEKINVEKNKASLLFINIQKALKVSKNNLQDIDFLFSTRGPGNFNGIRIALSFARGLALGNSLKAAGLSTLECLARSINTNKNVGVILKAFPEHFYFQLFDKNYIALRKPELININKELNIVLKKDNCIIVGNECNQFAAKIGFAGKVIHLDNPLSSGLMKSALHYLKIKKFQSPDPLYLRTANVSEPIHWKNSPVIE